VLHISSAQKKEKGKGKKKAYFSSMGGEKSRSFPEEKGRKGAGVEEEKSG